jgi:hypothetical protein
MAAAGGVVRQRLLKNFSTGCVRVGWEFGGIMTDPIFADRLMAGERIVWSGQPGGGVIFTARDIFLVPFSLAWCGFAIFWEASVARSGAPIFFMAWGAMFVCVGLGLVFGRFAFDAWVRRDTRYAVTDRRVLIARSGLFRSFTAVNRDQLPQAQLSQRANGRGTIRFGAEMSMWGNRGFSSWSPALDSTPQFIAIEDAGRVFDLVQRPSRT